MVILLANECPTDCKAFRCKMNKATCNRECDKVHSLCLLCSKVKSCPDLQQVEYIKDKVKNDDTISIKAVTIPAPKVYEMIVKHRMLEEDLMKIRKEYAKPSYNYPKKFKLGRESWRIKNEIEKMREFMDDVGIEYKITVDFKYT